jgi:hypothetical protein
MRNFTLPRGPCNFLDLRISPWEIPFPFLLSLFCLSPWRLFLFSLPPAALLPGRSSPASLPLLTQVTRGSGACGTKHLPEGTAPGLDGGELRDWWRRAGVRGDAAAGVSVGSVAGGGGGVAVQSDGVQGAARG